MLLNAKNGTVAIRNTDMDYISFGTGNEYLVMIPGLGDGFTTVKGTALPFAIAYRAFARRFKVFVFSRKNRLEDGYSIRDMAQDQVEAMKAVGIMKAHIIGISQGGMIAQYIGIDNPDVAGRLVLAVTLSKQNETIQNTVGRWIEMAQLGNFKDILVDTAEKSYSEKYLKRYRLLYPFLGRMGKPKDFKRFLIQADACIHHNAYDELNKITCPVLVIGGDCDKIVGTNASQELAQGIKNSKLYVYKGLGHGAYEEAKDFNQRVLDFLTSDINKQ